jgi:hypothetical protein
LVPIAELDADETLRQLAKLGEVEEWFGNDPAWMCPRCGLRSDDRERPHRAPRSRSRDEWLALIATMLPAPVRTNDDGELVAGEPSVVIVRVDASGIAIMEASIEWDGHKPLLKGRPFAKVPLRTSATRVAELIARAWGKRISRYGWCIQCKRRIAPEHGGCICDGCSTRVSRIVY